METQLFEKCLENVLEKQHSGRKRRKRPEAEFSQARETEFMNTTLVRMREKETQVPGEEEIAQSR